VELALGVPEEHFLNIFPQPAVRENKQHRNWDLSGPGTPAGQYEVTFGFSHPFKRQRIHKPQHPSL
jgi:hypothetical protein